METKQLVKKKSSKSKKKKIDDKCAAVLEGKKKLVLEPYYGDTFWRNELRLPPGLLSGYKILKSKRYNKGLAFTIRERQLLNIHGLLPYTFRTMEQQVEVVTSALERLKTSEAKRRYVLRLEGVNRRLYYKVMISNLKSCIPIFDNVHLDLSLQQQTIFRALFICIRDRYHIADILPNWPNHNIRCVAITNGANVFGDGDVGENALQSMLVEVQWLTILGGVQPDYCLPIFLDVGTDSEITRNNSSYIGLTTPRVTGSKFDAFFEELMTAIRQRFGPRVLLITLFMERVFAFQSLERYGADYCIMDVDVQARPACGLAAIIAAQKITNKELDDNVVVFYGINVFNIGMAKLFLIMLKYRGLTDEEAKQHIWFCDKNGLLTRNRPKEEIPAELLDLLGNHSPVNSLLELIALRRPNVLVGASSEPKAFNKDVLNAMAECDMLPLIMATSLPSNVAECTAEEAYMYTRGKCAFISSSLEPPLKYGGKRYQHSHIHSGLLLPGIVMGAMLAGMRTIPHDTFCVVASRLADLSWPKSLTERALFPPMEKWRCINLHIADAVFCYAHRRRVASVWPRPENPLEYIKSMQFKNDYQEILPSTYCIMDQNIGAIGSYDILKPPPS